MKKRKLPDRLTIEEAGINELDSHTDQSQVDDARIAYRAPGRTLLVALFGFFIITLDALVVTVALPEIRNSVGGGVSGLQWIMDGYTLPFAALLLFAGSISDRLGAKDVFAVGLLLVVISSIACVAANSLGLLVAARLAQGVGAALMTPASLSLIGEAFPQPSQKARAIGIWAMGGAVASASGPLIGGALTTISWRLIFLINIPVGILAAWLLAAIPRSSTRLSRFDWFGQVLSLIALVAMTFGLIQAGEAGIFSPTVLACFLLAIPAAIAFGYWQTRSSSPMVPPDLFRSYSAALPLAIGFAFMIAFFGMVFVVSIYLQVQRGLSPVQTGIAFAPVTAFSVFMPILAARLAERIGVGCPIVIGQAMIGLGLVGLAVSLPSASTESIVAWMIPVGLGGGLAMPSATSVLLNSVPSQSAGTASGVLNTCRQVGGALAIAAFGALITFLGIQAGSQTSLFIAAVFIVVTTVGSLRLLGSSSRNETSHNTISKGNPYATCHR